MLKNLLLISLSPVIFFACFFFGQVAQAATATYTVQANDTCTSIAAKYNITCDQLMNLNYFLIGQKLNVPGVVTQQGPQTPPPPVQQPTQSGLQIGFFQGPTGLGTWTQKYTDGAFPSGSGNLEVFMEPSVNDAAVNAGRFDSQLKSFAQGAAAHSGQVVLALGEEVNCSTDTWGGAKNTVQQTKDAFNHEASIVKGIAPNVKIMFSVNNDSCYGLPSAATYFPGNTYVDVLGLDGFDFGGQNWDAVFDHAIPGLQGFGKPIWIASEGAVSWDNQVQFVKDSVAGAAKYNIPVIIYFDYQSFAAPVSTLQGL